MYFDEYKDGEDRLKYGLADEDNDVRKMATHDTAGKMSVFGRRHAVIGGQFSEWRLKGEPSPEDSYLVSQYFDEDAALPDKAKGKGDENWVGSGVLELPDFCRLSDFLSNISGVSNV